MISQKTRSSLTITIGTILVSIGTILLVGLASGYNIDLLRGEIYATGLTLLGTNPGGASIKIDSKLTTHKTPYRLENVKTGTISVEYSLAGYYDWKANFFVKAGEVTFADYALLIPMVIESKQVTSNLIFTDIVASPEKNNLYAFIDNPGLVYEVKSNHELRKVAELPVNDSIKTPIKQSDILISGDGGSIATRATYDDGSSVYFWVNTSSGEFYNLNKIFNQPLTNIQISPRNNKDIYSLDAGKLSRVNTDSKKLSLLPASNITAFNLSKDSILALENLSPIDKTQLLVSYDYDGGNRKVLYQYPATSKPMQITSSKINNELVVAVSSPDNKGLTVYRQKDGKNLSSLIGLDTSLPSFSPDGRFLSFMQSSKLRTIDIEFTDRYSVLATDTGQIDWLTNYQMLLKKPNGLFIIDYNGYNLLKIPPNTSSLTDYKIATQRDSKSIIFLIAGKINYYSLEPRGGLINFR